MVSCLLSNIPFLESLTVAKCNGLQSIQLQGNLKLEKLTVLDCLLLESIRVHFNLQFSLKSFQFRGRVASFKYYNEDPLYYRYNSPTNDCSPFDLEEAMLDFRQGPGYYGINIPGFKLMLQSIRRVKTLTLCRWVFQVCCTWILYSSILSIQPLVLLFLHKGLTSLHFLSSGFDLTKSMPFRWRLLQANRTVVDW